MDYILTPSLLHFTVVTINNGETAGPEGADLQVEELGPGDTLLRDTDR